MNKKAIKVFLYCLLFPQATFGQFENYSSFEQLDSVSIEFFQQNKLDSATIIFENTFKNFPEHDGKATFILGFLYMKTVQFSNVFPSLLDEYLIWLNDIIFRLKKFKLAQKNISVIIEP